jgi:hypothetical protein
MNCLTWEELLSHNWNCKQKQILFRQAKKTILPFLRGAKMTISQGLGYCFTTDP